MLTAALQLLVNDVMPELAGQAPCHPSSIGAAEDGPLAVSACESRHCLYNVLDYRAQHSSKVCTDTEHATLPSQAQQVPSCILHQREIRRPSRKSHQLSQQTIETSLVSPAV